MRVMAMIDCCFIETHEGESEDQWRHAVEDMLGSLWDAAKPGWWHPFEAGPVVRWDGRAFRSFRCWAGSVFITMYFEATKRSLPRSLLLLGRYADGRVGGTAVTAAEEREFDGQDIVAQLAHG